ncbi:hypothetical protein HK57_00184 [Aspergillus ustus]|uniref:Uncharacterized protein n=1 Tax=Aspergillus ustus TaxID=40382 RepID=A0A0C1C2V6_ASPUT|nr:hypothetical protein HK57_00184 [Aspergillus ustus]
MPPASSVRPVQTALPSDTIWSHVAEDDFRHHLVTLQKQTNAVPMDVLTAEDDNDQQHYIISSPFLPLHIEKQFADDFAYIAAVTEGAQSVAAVCLEQHLPAPSLAPDCPTLVITVAGMDVIDEKVKDMLHAIVAQLQHRSQAVSSHRHNPPEADSSVDIIFRSIILQHEQKLLGRLRSRKWSKPNYLARTHKKPLWADFENLLHRAQHVYARRSERKAREAITASIQDTRKLYENFEASDGGTQGGNQELLAKLVRATFLWCKSPPIGEYASKLETAGATTPQTAAAIKTLRQLEKIGAYWRIANDLVAVTDQHRHLFRRVNLEYLTPYASVPTTIAYESWARTCHVHAEIQLVAELAKKAWTGNNASAVEIRRPRAIGTSKYLCYLCYLFLRYHGTFQMLSTHGRLYDQWTVPDLAEYDTAMRQRLAAVLKSMDEHVVKEINQTKCGIWRAEPMTSRQNLLLLDIEHRAVDSRDVEVEKLALS